MTGTLHRLKAALAERYDVVRELGAGGMATVYLARDLKHGRDIALKVLRPELAAVLGTDRFVREIEIAARLQHPHILPVYDSGEADGFLYYVMPYVEGESLGHRIAREGALPIDGAVRILTEVADALAYAHEHGLVHRDVKPDNLMLSGHHALVADFGIAKAVHAAAVAERLTATGIAIGTPAYMAPEQAMGEPTTDSRADLYALGAVAYEMLTGRAPFTGTTAQMVIAAHLAEPPDPVRRHRSAVPPALEALVMRLLEKHPADRVQTAAEVVRLLEAVTVSGATSATRAPSPRAVRMGIGAVVGAYAASSIAVLGAVWVLELGLGLPGWVLPAAVGLLAVGLPIILLARHLERTRAATDARTATGLRGWLTWRRALLGGVGAFGALGIGVTAYMLMRLLGIGPAGTLIASGVLSEDDRILLADFVDRTGDSTLAMAVTEALRVDLGQSASVTLVQQSELTDAFARMQREPPSTMTVDLANEVATREGIKAVVSGEINAVVGSYVISAQLLAPETGEVLVPVRETAEDSTHIIEAVDRLSNRLRERIGESLRSIRQTPPLARVTTASLPALRKYTLGVRAGDAGEVAQAIALFQEAVTLDTAFAAAYRGLAIYLGNWGIERALAAESMSRAFRFRDRLTEEERLWTTGSYYMARNQPQDALPSYLTLLETRPDDPKLINNIGVLYTMQRENARALEYYERALALQPTSPNSAFNVVVANLELGRNAEARAANGAFEAAAPGHPFAQINRFFIDVSARDFPDADSALAAFAAFGDPLSAAIVSTLRTSMAALHGRLTAADREIDAARQRALQGRQVPEYLRLVISAGTFDAVVRGRPDLGTARVTRALREFPIDNLPVLDRPYIELAEFYARAGEPARSRTFLAAYDREVPDEFRAQQSVDYDRAAAYLTLADGRASEAVSAFRAADRGQCRICTLPGLARAYDALGQDDSVRAVLERYVTLPDDDRWQVEPIELPGAYVRLGSLYEAVGDTVAAIEYDTRFLNLFRNADPEFAPTVARVRDALSRLVGEGR
jgi:tetratricopeptide (TPR) repeat protein